MPTTGFRRDRMQNYRTAAARLTSIIAAAFLAMSSSAQAAAPPTTLPTISNYTDLAVLTLDAPVIVHARIVKADPVPARDAPGVSAGSVRMHVYAALAGAILAPDAVPAAIDYLVDLPLTARGRPPLLRGAEVLLFLRRDARDFQLANARGEVAWSAATEATVREILTEARSGTVPAITGIGNAFRVPGNVAGEAESQFFLNTADGKPVSLVVLTRPGEAQRLSLALGDVIDDAAEGIPHDTLRWYRLACFLPAALPATIEADAGLNADYAFVLKSLGPCGQTLP